MDVQYYRMSVDSQHLPRGPDCGIDWAEYGNACAAVGFIANLASQRMNLVYKVVENGDVILTACPDKINEVRRLVIFYGAGVKIEVE